MSAGIRDIETSRELVRYAFALMAKDAVAQVDKGLRPEVTDSVTTLLTQRDQKIQYKVTDDKRDAEWIASVKSTSEAIQSFDKWSTIGLGTAKVLTTVAAGIFFSPAAGLAVATAWNVGDKVYRGVVGKESIKSLAKSFALELAIDTAFAALSSLKTTTVTLAGGSAVKDTAAQGLKLSKRVWEFKPNVSILKPHSIKEVTKDRGELVHSSLLVGVSKEQAKETFGKHIVIQKLGEKYFQQLSEKVPDALLRSNWAQIHVGRFVPFIMPTSVPSTPTKTPPAVEKKVDDDSAGRKKVAEQSLQAVPPDKKPKVVVDDILGVTKPPKEGSSPTAPAQVPTPALELTLAINPALLREIEAKLALSPNAEVQKAVDDLNSFMSQPTASNVEGEERLRGLQNALNQWAPYPELSSALDKLLTGTNPFLAFLNAPTTGFAAAAPPPQPPPPQAPPPPPPKDPGNSPGSGGGGMPGPVLVSNPIVRGDQQGTPRLDGTADDVRVVVADLNRASLGVASPRSELQGATMQEALARATPHQVQEARLLPHPQVKLHAQPTSSYVAVNHDLLLAEQRAKVIEALRTRTAEAEVGKRDEEARTESIAQREVVPVETRKNQKAAIKEDEHEVSVALKDSEPRGGRRFAPGEGAPRMVEREPSRSDVALTRDRSTVGASGEERLEATVAREGKDSTSPTLKSAPTAHNEGLAEPQVVGESRDDMRDIPNLKTENPRAPYAVNSLVVEAESSSAHAPSAETSKVVFVSRPHVSLTPVETPAASTVSSVHEAPWAAYGKEELSSPVHNDDLEALESDITVAAPSKSGRKLRRGDDARMRNLLLQQLMDQHTTKARREKILKALIALGISEVEYRKLLLKLGEMDAARLAEQVAARSKMAEPIAMTVEAPAMKDSSPEVSGKAENAPVESRPQTSRAALYKRLKEEATTARK
jgi:hypothetical protein